MKEFFKSLYTNKKRLAIVVAVVLIVGYVIYSHYNTQAAPASYVLGQASDQTIITSVSGTGQVSQDHTVNISPGSSGKLTSIDVTQGQAVKTGQTIAIVDETSNTEALNQAKAGLASAQASYDQTMAGDTTQDLELAQLAVQSDQQGVTNASSSLATTEKQDNTNVANALSNLLNSTPQAVASIENTGTGAITISGNYIGTQQGSYTITVYGTGSGLNFQYSGLENGADTVRTSPPIALGANGLYISFTGKPASGDTWTISIPNIQANNYINNYNSYQSALANQATDITNGQNSIASAENKLQQDQINLQTKQLPPTAEQVASAQASLTSAQAQLANAELAYNNNILTAPFDGTVAELNNQVGDQVTTATTVATVVNNQSISIIPLNEVDVAKVAIGDKASMTFDAVDGLTITGTVVEIDNIGTVSQGVVSYNVKIAFDTEDPRVKPGMSVAASIITNIAADVLSVPNAAVQTQGSTSYVLTLNPSDTSAAPTGQQGVIAKVAPTRVVVQTGASDDTNTQITSGSLTAGESIVVQTINASATKSAAATATSALRLGGGGGFGGGGGGGFGGGAGGATRVTVP